MIMLGDLATTYESNVGYRLDGLRCKDNRSTHGHTALSTGDYIGLCIRNGKPYWNLNGTWDNSGDPDAETDAVYSGLTGKWCFVVSFYRGGKATIRVNPDDWEGSGLPSDIKSLTATTYGDPDNWKPQDHADILTYTANGTAIGSGGLSVTGLNFQPDLLEIKSRDNTYSWKLFASILTALNADGYIEASSDSAINTSSEGIDSYDSGGFTTGNLGGVNNGSEDHASLAFKYNGSSTVTNNDGTLETEISVNVGAGISIGTFTGTAANGTFGTELDNVDMYMLYNTVDAQDVCVYHGFNTSAPETDYLERNKTTATQDDSGKFNNTAPVGGVCSTGVDGDVNGYGDTMFFIAFDFSKGVVTGGLYNGNGNSDGTFIPTDELLLWVNKKTSSADDWSVHDQRRSPYNIAMETLLLDSSYVEVTSYGIDFLFNGIKIRNSNGRYNTSGGTYIWWGIKKNGGHIEQLKLNKGE